MGTIPLLTTVEHQINIIICDINMDTTFNVVAVQAVSTIFMSGIQLGMLHFISIWMTLGSLTL